MHVSGDLNTAPADSRLSRRSGKTWVSIQLAVASYHQLIGCMPLIAIWMAWLNSCAAMMRSQSSGGQTRSPAGGLGSTKSFSSTM